MNALHHLLNRPSYRLRASPGRVWLVIKTQLIFSTEQLQQNVNLVKINIFHTEECPGKIQQVQWILTQ